MNKLIEKYKTWRNRTSWGIISELILVYFVYWGTYHTLQGIGIIHLDGFTVGIVLVMQLFVFPFVNNRLH